MARETVTFTKALFCYERKREEGDIGLLLVERYPFLCTLFLRYYQLSTNYGKERI